MAARPDRDDYAWNFYRSRWKADPFIADQCIAFSRFTSCSAGKIQEIDHELWAWKYQFRPIPLTTADMIISESNTADIIIDQWISTEQGEASLCGITPQLINSGFPGYLVNDINSKCQPDAAERDINLAPSPTPPVMVSGKIAKSEGLAQPWLTLMYGSHPELTWVPGLETKYDISWLQTLSPVWISGWGN